MDEASATATIASYEDLLDRALNVVKGAPFWRFVDEPDFAKLKIDDGSAQLYWPNDETYYDATTIETESISFPSRLLFISDEELKEWKALQMLEYEKEQTARKKRGAQEAIERERQLLRQLQAKYGQ